MFEFMLECHLLMLFLILLRALFGSFLSAKMRYALWLFIPLRFLPFGLLFEAGKQTVLVNLIGKILAMLPQVSFARFDASRYPYSGLVHDCVGGGKCTCACLAVVRKFSL